MHECIYVNCVHVGAGSRENVDDSFSQESGRLGGMIRIQNDRSCACCFQSM